MKLVRWRRFTWGLAQLPELENTLPQRYSMREATRGETRDIQNVIFSSFSLDAAWGDALNLFRDRLEYQVEQALARPTVPSLVVTHGQRIIAASVLTTDDDTDSHLVSGPCVLSEYRNRGIGTILLWGSLMQLREAGLGQAHGVTKEHVAASKFLYPKFGSTNQPWEYQAAMVGA